MFSISHPRFMCARLSGQKHITLQHLLGKVGVMIDPPPITGHKAGRNDSEMKQKRLKHQSPRDKFFRETDCTERRRVFTVGRVCVPFASPPQGWNHIFRFQRGLGTERVFRAHVFLPQSFPNLISILPGKILYHQSAAKHRSRPCRLRSSLRGTKSLPSTRDKDL